jgi:TolB protein
VPALPTSQSVSTPAGTTDELGVKIAQVIADDLRNSGLFAPTGPEGSRTITMSEVHGARNIPSWTGFEALVHGFVRSAGGESDITVGCYLYDTALKSELERKGLCRRPTRLAPRRAQMRRCHLCPSFGRKPVL